MNSVPKLVVAALALVVAPVPTLGQSEDSPPTVADQLPDPAPSSGDLRLDDLRCFRIVEYLGRSATPEAQQSFGATAVFFMGKLMGRDPAFSLVTANAAYADVLMEMDAAAQYARCLAEFRAMGRSFTAEGGS